jgi:hypothetical protein
MPRKVIELNLNPDEIKKRIALDKGDIKNNKWAALLHVSPSLISQIHPKGADKPSKTPSLEYIIAVSRYTGKSLEWYLYGENTPAPLRKLHDVNQHPLLGDPQFWSNWSDEDIRLCQQLKRILDSNHPVAKPAIISNLAAFELSILSEKKNSNEIVKLKKRVQQLETVNKPVLHP